MGKAQREKGAAAEREVAEMLRHHGIDARRGQVFNHEEDIVSDLPLHLEIKRQETTKIHEWFKQSCDQSRGKTPVVVHRRSREPWMITLRFEDFLDLIGAKHED